MNIPRSKTKRQLVFTVTYLFLIGPFNINSWWIILVQFNRGFQNSWKCLENTNIHKTTDVQLTYFRWYWALNTYTVHIIIVIRVAVIPDTLSRIGKANKLDQGWTNQNFDRSYHKPINDNEFTALFWSLIEHELDDTNREICKILTFYKRIINISFSVTYSSVRCHLDRRIMKDSSSSSEQITLTIHLVKYLKVEIMWTDQLWMFREIDVYI